MTLYVVWGEYVKLVVWPHGCESWCWCGGSVCRRHCWSQFIHGLSVFMYFCHTVWACLASFVNNNVCRFRYQQSGVYWYWNATLYQKTYIYYLCTLLYDTFTLTLSSESSITLRFLQFHTPLTVILLLSAVERAHSRLVWHSFQVTCFSSFKALKFSAYKVRSHGRLKSSASMNETIHWRSRSQVLIHDMTFNNLFLIMSPAVLELPGDSPHPTAAPMLKSLALSVLRCHPPTCFFLSSTTATATNSETPHNVNQQGVAQTRRNTTGPPSVLPRIELHCAAVECYRRRQTPAKHYWPTTLCVGGPVITLVWLWLL